MWPYPPSLRLPQPSFRHFRHSGESRNLGGYGHNHRHSSFFVIPAQAGIQGVWSYAPSFRLPQQPSLRRKPESTACGHMHCHCGASRNPESAVIITVIPVFSSFRRKPESMACGHMHRHCGASRNLWRVAICTVIAAQAGIQGVRPPQPSFRRKPESMACSHMHRHCGASRNPGVRSYSPSFQFFRHSGLRRNLRAATDSGFRRNDGPIPKPPEKKHYPCSQRPQFARPRGNHRRRPRPDALTGQARQC